MENWILPRQFAFSNAGALTIGTTSFFLILSGVEEYDKKRYSGKRFKTPKSKPRTALVPAEP